MTEYTGWDNYVNRKRTDEQLKQIKEEWKGAVNDYFGRPEKEMEDFVNSKISKLYEEVNKSIYTLHQRINNITDCGHGKLKQMVTPLHQANVIGRIEALEQWREKIADVTQLDKRVWELENNMKAYHEPMMESWKNKHHERILKLEEWTKNGDNTQAWLANRIRRLEEWQRSHYFWPKNHDDCNNAKVIDKKVWEEIKYYTSKIDHYSWPRVDRFGDLRACVYKLKEYIKEVDPEFCPND